MGSRDLIDAFQLCNYYKNSSVYAFECNPDCLIECETNLLTATEYENQHVHLIKNAISTIDGDITFYPFDLTKYNNMGASSMLKIDFSMHNKDDPDYNKTDIQKNIIVSGIRLDSFMEKNNIMAIDLLCIDLQGYELNAIKSLGDKLKNVKYIITECSIKSTYSNGATFQELNEYLNTFNFKYVCSNKFNFNFPNLNLNGFSEFDALFINSI